MALAALFALTLLASGPSSDPAPAAVAVSGDSDEDIPPGAPTDDYGFVAWCYGAMDESILVYQQVIPELTAIDRRIGSPVHEAVPYADDVAEERLALKRFAAAMEAAERASPEPIADRGAADINLGRSIWSQAKLQPPRRLAQAWLMWGSPDHCETVAQSLKTRATLLGQAMAIDAPTVDAPAPVAPALSTPAADTPASPASAQAPDTIDSILSQSRPPTDGSTPPAK